MQDVFVVEPIDLLSKFCMRSGPRVSSYCEILLPMFMRGHLSPCQFCGSCVRSLPSSRVQGHWGFGACDGNRRTRQMLTVDRSTRAAA